MANRLKYRISEILGGLSPVTRQLKRKQMVATLNINDSTLSRWINATENEQQDIDGYSLAMIAHVLCVSVDELYNKDLVFEKSLQNLKA